MNTFNVLVATGAKVEFYIERSLFTSCGLLVHHDNRPLTTVGQTTLPRIIIWTTAIAIVVQNKMTKTCRALN